MIHTSGYNPKKRVWLLLVLAGILLLGMQPAWAGNPLKTVFKGAKKVSAPRKFSSQQL